MTSRMAVFVGWAMPTTMSGSTRKEYAVVVRSLSPNNTRRARPTFLLRLVRPKIKHHVQQER